jgi:hypothetical protein
MKTNSTLVFKVVLFTLLTFASVKSFSSTIITTDSPVINLTASVKNSSLLVNWTIAPNTATSYCEVQASEDGTTFTTIGYVMGADPKQGTNTFSFKQDLKKIKPGKVFYRVLHVTDTNTVVASTSVKISK